MRARIIIVAMLAVALAGCGTSTGSGLVRPALPALPPALAASCTPPAAKPGDEARVVAARGFAAYGKCARKHANTVGFYDDLRRRLGGQK